MRDIFTYRTVHKIQLRVNIGKSKVMRRLKYINVCEMHMRLNGEPLAKSIA